MIRPGPASGWLMAACGAWLAALGLYFMFIRSSLLPEDLRYIGLDLGAIRTAVPGLEPWLAKVFTVMGGFMTGAGVLTLHLALTAIPRRLPGTTGVLAVVGLATVGLMSTVNFMLASDFRWLLVVPALLWAAGTALHAMHPSESRDGA
jgi:hypothetical protein